MKKTVLGLFLAAVITFAGVGVPSAFAVTGQTDVTGVVTENGNAVAGADVTVVCGTQTKNDTTDAHGSYLVVFDIPDCPFGSTAKVTAKKGGKSGHSSGTIMGFTTKLNVGIINVSIPEFGMTAALVSAGAGVGFIGYMRRRQVHQV